MAIPGTTLSQVLHLNCSLKLLHEVLANTTVYIFCLLQAALVLTVLSGIGWIVFVGGFGYFTTEV